MKTQVSLALLCAAAFAIGVGFSSSTTETRAQSHGTHRVGTVSLMVVSPGQLVCLAGGESVATFEVQDGGTLKRVDIDAFVPPMDPSKVAFYKELYGPDE
jgi:hypothetical protein